MRKSAAGASSRSVAELNKGAARSYLPLKSAFAPKKQQQQNNTNLIHKSMISRLWFMIPVIQGKKIKIKKTKRTRTEFL